MKLTLSLLLVAWMNQSAFAVTSFGYSGSDGYSGSNGSDGRSGSSITLTADGVFKQFDLRGRPGSDAGHGSDGSNASSCYQGRPSHDLVGADGGDGGNGGAGGDGGSGGDTLVYYKNISDLKAIKIFNGGAPGGRSGAPGYGGDGCSCSQSSWTIEHCSTDDDGNKKCHDDRYTCTNGDSGSRGSRPSDGSHGSRGDIHIVKDLAVLPQELPYAGSTLGELINTPKHLTRRIWAYKNGATGLFHPESNIGDGYAEYVRLAEKDFAIVWKVNRPFSDFAKVKVSLSFDGKNISANIGEGIFFVGHYEQGESMDQYVITQAFLASDLDNLELGIPTGTEENLQIVITDKAQVTNLIETKVSTTLVFKRKLIGLKTVFYGEVPKEFLDTTEDSITIAAGKLADQKAKKFNSKRKMYMEIDVVRSFGGRSITKHLSLPEYKIP